MTRFALIGPTHPYRGGIAHYTTLLARQLRQDHELLLLSFARQYPQWLFPGQSDKDPSERPLQTDAEYLLDPLNPLTWRRATRRLQAWRPDAVIMQWWHPFWAPAWSALGRAVKRLPHQPRLLYICHNVLPHEQGAGRAVWPGLTRFVLAPADYFLVHSAADGRILQQILPQARYVVALHPTYAALGEAAEAALPFILPDDRPLLLFAGFVRPYKGLDILLEALAEVVKRQPLHLLVAGEFWQGTTVYQQQIDRLNLNESVTLIDAYLPNELLAACLKRADVIVLPYRSATQSGIIQAAFGQTKPVITTDVGGLAEAVTHGETGLVVPPDDPTALAAAIEQFFTEQMAVRLSANIAAEMDRFSWRALVARLEMMKDE
jgi:glycosyltransferase involved in cell wall biosynthesis